MVEKSANIDDPPASYYIVTGSIGVSLYSFLIILSVVSMVFLYLRHGFDHNSNTKLARFGLFIFGTCGSSLLWDIPRWAEMIKTGSYRAQYAYALHLLANIFFYGGYSAVVLLFWQATKLTTESFQFIYGCIPANTLSGIYIVNASNIIFCSIGIVYCALSDSLDAFFDSYFYGIFQFHELLINVAIVLSLFNNAFKLRGRILSFIKATRPTIEDDLRGTIDATINAMTRKMFQIFMIMVCCAIGVILRISILAIKYSDNQHDQGSTGHIEMYSASWFLFSDFLPRTLATLSFLVFLRRPTRKARDVEEVEEIEDSQVDEVIMKKSFSYNASDMNDSYRDSENGSIPLSNLSHPSNADLRHSKSEKSVANPMNDINHLDTIDVESQSTDITDSRNTDTSKMVDITTRYSYGEDSMMESTILEGVISNTISE